MSGLHVMVIVVLTALAPGCANRGAQTDDHDLAHGSDPVTDGHAALTDLAGPWSGTNRLWFMPDDPVRESESTAAVDVAALGAVLVITYTWSYEGKPQEGVLTVRTAQAADAVGVVWYDTWHTGNAFMSFSPEEGRDGLVAVRGTYGAPTGPDWGWRIVLEADGPDAFVILMDNITPEGEETRAVEARFTREGAGG